VYSFGCIGLVDKASLRYYNYLMNYFIIFLSLFLSVAANAQNFPMTLAGISLGENIGKVQSHCRLATDIVLEEERHLKEMELKPQFVPGVKSGSVAYANCEQPGRIVRIKLKFDNPSKEFFNDLLRRYKVKFGNPIEWRGNPFQTVISWKWSFQDDRGQRVGLELTHSDNEDYKIGNFVKFTLRSLWDQEDACYEKKHAAEESQENKPTPAQNLQYDLLIPQ
jgi:hypothetical protein